MEGEGMSSIMGNLMRENGEKVKNMAMECMCMKMGIDIKEISSKIKNREKAAIFGRQTK